MRSIMQRTLASRSSAWARLGSLCFIALNNLPARAAVLLDCEPKDSLLVCQLRSLLAVLHTVAIILGFLLAVAILFAVRAYRSKPRNTLPHKESKPDA